MAGQCVGMVDREQPAAEIIAELIGPGRGGARRAPAALAEKRGRAARGRASPGPLRADDTNRGDREFDLPPCRDRGYTPGVPDDMKRLSQFDAAAPKPPGWVRNCATRGLRLACRSRISRSRSASAGSIWPRWRKAGSATCRRRPMPSASSAPMPRLGLDGQRHGAPLPRGERPGRAAQDRPDLSRGGARPRRAGRGGDAGGRPAGGRRLYRLVPVVRQRQPHGGCRAAAAARDRAGDLREGSPPETVPAPARPAAPSPTNADAAPVPRLPPGAAWSPRHRPPRRRAAAAPPRRKAASCCAPRPRSGSRSASAGPARCWSTACCARARASRCRRRDGLLLSTGNAGGLEVLVDGQPTPGLGAGQSVRRDLQLDAGAG